MFQFHGPRLREPNLQDAIFRIKNDAPWLEEIKRGAAKKGISLDSAIIENALYILAVRKK